METNNLFQNQANQNYGNMNWNGQNNMGANQQPYYGNFITRTSVHTTSNNIPVRVVFSPEQIAPQEIPTNGTPALFPLSDGSCIIARSLMPNGRFDEQIYALVPKNQNGQQPQTSEFDQLMMRLDKIEGSLNSIIQDLYGGKKQSNQEGTVSENE